MGECFVYYNELTKFALGTTFAFWYIGNRTKGAIDNQTYG